MCVAVVVSSSKCKRTQRRCLAVKLRQHLTPPAEQRFGIAIATRRCINAIWAIEPNSDVSLYVCMWVCRYFELEKSKNHTYLLKIQPIGNAYKCINKHTSISIYKKMCTMYYLCMRIFMSRCTLPANRTANIIFFAYDFAIELILKLLLYFNDCCFVFTLWA